jgi:acyl-CoA synthetase (AMP-forming)/AMP-acid ligase II/acyl carrier protein
MTPGFFQPSRPPDSAIAHGDAVAPGSRPATLAEGFALAIERFPSGAFAFLDEAGRSRSSTYAEVLAHARRIVGGLRRRGVRPGDKLILYFTDSAAFIPALWGALLAGAVPVPLMRSERSRDHAVRTPLIFDHLRTVLDAPKVLTDAPPGDRGMPSRIGAGDVFTLEELDEPSADGDWRGDPVEGPRLLILSSGTTATPNLVALGERALIHRWWPALPNAARATTFLSWSPLDHVMGLGLASPNLSTKVHLPASAFLRSPALWLSAATRFRVTHATMTNFGLSLVEQAVTAASVADRDWNLSAVQKIGVGAEAISPEACRRFVSALRPFGLSAETLILGYGLSECGPVAGGDHAFSVEEGADQGPFPLIDRPTQGHSIRIVGERGAVLPQGAIGAVEVRGPTMAIGYYGDDIATQALFTRDGWIRTGDLGSLTGGRLAITGREKEIIVVRARKYACAEVDAVAASVAGVETAVAVPGIPDRRRRLAGQDRFAIFIVTSVTGIPGLRVIVRQVRRRIADHFGMSPIHVVPIAKEEIPRTRTGKVQRFELAARLRAGAYGELLAQLRRQDDPSSRSGYASDVEAQIATIWAEILGTTDFDRDDDFFEIGGDSLSAEMLALAIEQRFGKPVPADLLYRRTTIARLAASADDGSPGGAHKTSPPARGARSRVAGHRNAPQRKRDHQALVWAVETARAGRVSPRDLLTACDFLVSYAMVDEAEAAIGRLAEALARRGLEAPRSIGHMLSINRQFARLGLAAQSRQLGDLGRRLLSASEEAVLWKVAGSDRLLVVFNSLHGDFWVSGPVLHCLLRDSGVNILYLKDPGWQFYMAGLPTFGRGFDALVAGIEGICRDVGARDVRTMGFSSGGYAALLAAATLRAQGVLGFSISTDFSRAATLPPDSLAAARASVPDGPFLDLKPLLVSARTPGLGVLYYGEDSVGDAAHARRLADLPNFIAKEVRGARHNTVMALLAEGKFQRIVRRFLR